MSTNSHHASYKGIRKDFNYGSNRREFPSENGLEPQTANFSGNPTRNSPLASMNQKDLPRDLFEKNSPSNGPLKVKDLQNQQQKMYQQEKEETITPPQPIINDKTLLALDYLQKYLLPNKTLQSINLPSTNPNDHDQESLYLKGSENFVSKNLDGDFGYQNPKIIEVETNQRPRDSSYLTENEKYERSRSRSNEKKGSYDRIPRNRTNRSPYSKSYKNNLVEENVSERSKKEDWECGNCGNINWIKQRNCKKCGQKQNENPSSPDGSEFHSYHKGDSHVKRSDYRNFNNANISGK